MEELTPSAETRSFDLKPFVFKQCVSILKPIPKKAKSLRELRKLISTVSDESIFHHTYQYFLKGHFMEYTNDFAHWVGENLGERALAERLSNMDPYTFKSIDDVRKELLRIIDEHIETVPSTRQVIPGDEFHFNETITLMFPIGIKAKNLAEFLVALKHVDAGCIYFHFYEARIRLGGGVDDFSKWIDEVVGKKELAEKIRAIDPFMHNIEGVREHIAEIVEEDVRASMEGVEG